jgi:hypothetical protein
MFEISQCSPNTQVVFLSRLSPYHFINTPSNSILPISISSSGQGTHTSVPVIEGCTPIQAAKTQTWLCKQSGLGQPSTSACPPNPDSGARLGTSGPQQRGGCIRRETRTPSALSPIWFPGWSRHRRGSQRPPKPAAGNAEPAVAVCCPHGT